MNRLRIVNLLLLAALWAASALAWPGLPEQIPQHVGVDGVTTWRATSLWSWFLLPATATLTVLLLQLVTRLMPRYPRLVNIPGKEQLTALPPERQGPVLARAADLMEGTTAVMLLVFCMIQLGLWHAAHGGSTQTVLVVVLPLALLSTPLVIGIWLPRITNELERQVREHRAAGGSVPMTLALLSLLSLGACAGDAARAPAAEPPAAEWHIAVGGAEGTVGPATTHADLSRIFAGEISDTMIHVGEGQFEAGTVIHPGDPLRRAEIIWQDSARTRPWRIQVQGDSTVWTIGPGITLGTTLAELARLNGRSLPITGFGWDYGGTIMGWDQGALETALLGGNGRVILRLAPAPEMVGTDDFRAMSGDGVFRSDAPAMERLAPAVRQIIVEYDEPA